MAAVVTNVADPIVTGEGASPLKPPVVVVEDAVDMLDMLAETQDISSAGKEVPKMVEDAVDMLDMLSIAPKDGKKHDVDFDAFASDSSLQVHAAVEASPVSNDTTVDKSDAPNEKTLPAASDPELLVIEEESSTEKKDRSRYVTPKDFELLKVIGMGAFGKVLQVRNKQSKKILAMKVISKRLLKRNSGYVENIRAERDILTKIRHPFVVTMHCSFQTREKLFIIMDFLGGGELFLRIGREGIFLEKTAAFYLAEIVLALDHLHTRGILHRDLKPENILLSKDGHVCLTDFGLAKDFSTDGGFQSEDDESRARTVCGTQEYMAPEMVARKGYGRAADYWSLGCIAYEMLSGLPPFISKQGAKDLFRKIMSEKVKMPTGSTAAACKLLKGLLNRNVTARLGAARGTMFEVGGVAGLKKVDFFKGIDWEKLERLEVEPPAKVHVDNEEDLRHFHDEFTKMPLPRSVTEMSMEGTNPRRCASDHFRGFSFVQHDFDLPTRHIEEMEQYWTHVEGDGESVSDCASSKLDPNEFECGQPSAETPVPEKKKRPPRKRKKKKAADALSPVPSENGDKTPPPSTKEDENRVEPSATNAATLEPAAKAEHINADDNIAGDALANKTSSPVAVSAKESEPKSTAPSTPLPRKQPPKKEKWESVGGSPGKKGQRGGQASRFTPVQASKSAANTNGSVPGLRPTAPHYSSSTEKPMPRSTAAHAQQRYLPAPGSWAAMTTGNTASGRPGTQGGGLSAAQRSALNGTNASRVSANESRGSTGGTEPPYRPTLRPEPAPSGDWRQHSMVRQNSKKKESPQPPAPTERQTWPSLGDFPPVGSNGHANSSGANKTKPKGAWASRLR